MNNMYSRDIAKKIRAALETNWKNGKATCTNVPFGYVWNKKGGQRWEIDPEAAPCVKKVFELALSGRNTTQIAYGIEKKKALSEKLAVLQDSIRTEKEEQECADELDEEIRALTKQASEKTYIGGLTKECVDAFVSMVYLYDDQTMKIEFNCEDVIRRALEKYGA